MQRALGNLNINKLHTMNGILSGHLWDLDEKLEHQRLSQMSYAPTAKEVQVTGGRFYCRAWGFASNEDVLFSEKKSRSEIGSHFSNFN